MNADERRYDDVTHRIIACAFAVSNELGVGFLEKVYENAMVVALTKSGLTVIQQAPIKVHFQGVVVGEYVADLLVENSVLIELKAVQKLDQIHEAQCINYLRATGMHVCLLINFAKTRLEWKRIVHNL